ncbi:hypothetical protein ULMS_24080 [Patiriisocius marinistellae]|uniref:Gliding motility-associated protein GldM N-terminal domain-containing protein n=1 Tax=Patiriisocius marinistellae TaxID=2494560 RepID=A0A5J4FXC4_9FLAO|nr:hypothetical protein [Patiriisocius marinistellae]GEQ86900.1 hypothetical protein ULMS_24080 [Patiriisocius marinistellae]
MSCNNIAEKNNNEVLDASKKINISLEKANIESQSVNDATLQIAIKEYPLYSTQLIQVSKASEQLRLVIDSLKSNGLELSENYQEMNGSKYYDTLFFEGDNISEKGQTLVSAIENYRHTLRSNFRDRMPQFIKTVQPLFTTHSINGKLWLVYHFKGFSTITTITKLTQIEADIVQTNNRLVDMISQM